MDLEKAVKIEITDEKAANTLGAVSMRLATVAQALKTVLPDPAARWKIDTIDRHDDGSITVEMSMRHETFGAEAVVYLNADGTPSVVITDHPSYQPL